MDPKQENKLDTVIKTTDLSLHKTITNMLRSRILKGSYTYGSKLPTLRKFAEEFRVSTMTVRRAFLSLEREGLVTRLPGVGVFARSTPPAKAVDKKSLAYVSLDLSSAFDMALTQGIEKACQKYGWSFQILNANLDVTLETRNIQRLPDYGVQGGIVLPPWNQENIDTLFEIQSKDFPVVLLDRTIPGLYFDLVASDHEAGSYRATRYFLENGHSQIYMLTHQPLSSSVSARIRGYERALREAGKKVLPERRVILDPKIQELGYQENRRWRGGFEAMLPVLKKNKLPVAVLAIDAYTTLGVYEACHELGLRIPDDVSVIGFDDSEIAHIVKPPTTIIAQRADEIGHAAVELLERRISTKFDTNGSRKTCTHVTIDVDLIERQSVSLINRD